MLKIVEDYEEIKAKSGFVGKYDKAFTLQALKMIEKGQSNTQASLKGSFINGNPTKFKTVRRLKKDSPVNPFSKVPNSTSNPDIHLIYPNTAPT